MRNASKSASSAKSDARSAATARAEIVLAETGPEGARPRR
jgi:hypothetical protein